jgi:hypothetical protein
VLKCGGSSNQSGKEKENRKKVKKPIAKQIYLYLFKIFKDWFWICLD